MARQTLSVDLSVDRIHCHDEGDGWGVAEPYLWTVFFKIDGGGVRVTDAARLAGSAVVLGTPGSHGNLGTTDVDAGEDVTVPSLLGEFGTQVLIPIRGGVADVLGKDFDGVIGVVCVLMEEDNVTHAGAEAGHTALNLAVQDVLDQVIATRSISMVDVTEEEIHGFEEQISDAVENAVQAQQGFFENIWSWLNADDTIGTKTFMFTTDQLVASGGLIDFSHRWDNHGDWEIFGHVTSTALCPANSLDAVFSGSVAQTTLSSDGQVLSRQVIDTSNLRQLQEQKEPVAASEEGRVFDLATLRQFRDGAYRETPGLGRWWELAERNLPSAVYALFRHAELREPAYAVMKELPRVVQDPDAVPESLLENVAVLAEGLRKATGNRRLRIDAGRVRSAVEHLRGKTFREVAAFLDAVEPSRHPRLDAPAEPTRTAIRLGGTRIAQPVSTAGTR